MIEGFGEVAERLRRATVEVDTGSGVIWDAAGLIITNAHVARGPKARVTLWDGRSFEATVAARDPRRDVASLRIPAGDLPAAAAGDSSTLRVGELVMAVGNPLGFVGALSTGVVHALSRRWVHADVRLAPGNSGGPLADARGRVIGINTLIANGVALAVPSNSVDRWLRHGAEGIELGVVVRPVPAGILVLEVQPGSPAARSSLMTGDLLVGANGRAFQSLDDLGEAIQSSAGGVLRLEFLRGDRSARREVSVHLHARAAEAAITRAGVESLLRSNPQIELVMDGADVVIAEEEPPAELAESGPPVIVLSDDPQWSAEALRAGVRAVLPRELSAAEMVAAVEAAAAGLAVLYPRELEALLPAHATRPVEALSRREVEVLGMMAEGISNKEIAARLGISEHTVKFHVAQIMGKLGAGTRTEAVMVGVRTGLIMV